MVSEQSYQGLVRDQENTANKSILKKRSHKVPYQALTTVKKSSKYRYDKSRQLMKDESSPKFAMTNESILKQNLQHKSPPVRLVSEK